MAKKSMRASSFELATKCRGSFWLDSHGSVFATEGTAFHEAVEEMLNNKGMVDFDVIQTKYALSNETMGDIRYSLSRIELSIPAHAKIIPEVRLNCEVGEFLITGKPDLLIIDGTEATGIDYKFGRGAVTPANRNGQVGIYVFLIFVNHPEVQTIHFSIIQPRINEVTSETFEREPFLEKWTKVIYQVVKECYSCEEKPEFVNGAHCKDCWSNMGCPAFGREVLKFANLVSKKWIDNTEDALKLLLPMAKACQSLSYRIEAVAKDYVDKHGDLIISEDSYYVKEQTFKDKIIPKKAFPVLREIFPEEEIEQVISISKADIKKLTKGKERGTNAKVFKQLDEAGAIEQNESTRYSYVKSKPKLKAVTK